MKETVLNTSSTVSELWVQLWSLPFKVSQSVDYTGLIFHVDKTCRLHSKSCKIIGTGIHLKKCDQNKRPKLGWRKGSEKGQNSKMAGNLARLPSSDVTSTQTPRKTGSEPAQLAPSSPSQSWSAILDLDLWSRMTKFDKVVKIIF